MSYIIGLIHILFPLVALILLIIGITTTHKNFTMIALWLSLVAIVLHYQTSGGEILGSYFDYTHAFIYSLNLLVLLISFIILIIGFSRESDSTLIRSLTGFIAAGTIIGIMFLLGNLWINAYFIEDRMAGTPVLQVATFKKLDYCSYNYVFYKVSKNGGIGYMCPNYYGLLPAVGYLKTAPDYLIRQLPAPLQAKFQKGLSEKPI